MPHHSGLVIEAQVDYLRCSAHGQSAAQNLTDLARGLAEEERARGNRERRWRLMGYEGTHVGRVAYGKRDEASSILDLSGQAANEYLSPALAVADTVTRVDLAVTWRADSPRPTLGPDTYAQMLEWYQADTRRARPSTTNDGAGGYTAYLGQRQSENFLRLYNKEAECRSTQDWAGVQRYQNCWRYELEVKGGLSQKIAHEVDDHAMRWWYVRSYLWQFLTAHGVEPAFPLDGSAALLPGFSRRSDDDVSLRHLAKNVKPTLKRLSKHGRTEDALVALGLASSKEILTLGGVPMRHTLSHGVERSTLGGANGKGSVVRKQATSGGEHAV